MRVGAPVCVGLDPVAERLPASIRSATGDDPVRGIEAFSRAVVEAVAPAVPCIKIQSACFERYGAAGFAVMARVIAEARALGLIVILDGKRGDIGLSTAHYAAAAMSLGAHWVTVSPYLGDEGIVPFVDAGLGAFALVRTSNPSGDAIQTLPLADGRSVAEAVADEVERLAMATRGARSSDFGAVGAVVGATHPEDAARLRVRMPHAIFLVPGYGAQGAGGAEIRACFLRGITGAIVTASRSVLYAAPEARDVRAAIHQAAMALADEVTQALAVPG